MRLLTLIAVALLTMTGTAQSFTTLSLDIDVQAGILDLALAGSPAPFGILSETAECGGISVAYLSATSSNTGRFESDGPRNTIILHRKTWPTNAAGASHDFRFSVDEVTLANVTARLASSESQGMQSDLLCRLWDTDTDVSLVDFDGSMEWIQNPVATLDEVRWLPPGNYGWACSALIANQNSIEDDFGSTDANATGFFDIDLIPVPEPTVAMGMGAGVLFLAGVRRRRRC